MAAEKPLVSIIVPTYKREAILCQTLHHLLSLTYSNLELIVIDQTPHHRPATEACLQALGRHPHFHYHRLSTPGLPHARNVGARLARGAYLLYCDDDIIPPPNLVELHLRNYRDPKVGAVTGGIRPEKKALPPKPKVCVIRPDGRMYSYWEHPVPRGETDSLIGCNMSVPRTLALDVGLFDEGYIGKANWEETDFSFRIRERGYIIMYDPEAAVVHLMHNRGGVRTSLEEDAGRFYYESHYNNAYFFRKNISHRYLPWFLKRELGWILVKRGLGQRQLHLVLPSLLGLWDGWWAAGRRPGT